MTHSSFVRIVHSICTLLSCLKNSDFNCSKGTHCYAASGGKFYRGCACAPNSCVAYLYWMCTWYGNRQVYPLQRIPAHTYVLFLHTTVYNVNHTRMCAGYRLAVWGMLKGMAQLLLRHPLRTLISIRHKQVCSKLNYSILGHYSDQ